MQYVIKIEKEHAEIGFIRTCKKKGQRDCNYGRAEKEPALSINCNMDMAGERKTSRQVKWNCVSDVGRVEHDIDTDYSEVFAVLLLVEKIEETRVALAD